MLIICTFLGAIITIILYFIGISPEIAGIIGAVISISIFCYFSFKTLSELSKPEV